MSDMDHLRQPWESDEHWELRKEFLKVHEGKFPENRLLCLAQVYTNVELLGCKYPNEVMCQVCELAKDMKHAAKLREKRKGRAQIQFVKAEEEKKKKKAEKRQSNDYGSSQNKFSRSWNNQDVGSNSYQRSPYAPTGYGQNYNSAIPSYTTTGRGGRGNGRQGVW